MFKNLKKKASLFWMTKAQELIQKGGYKNIMKGLRYLKYGAMLAEPEERAYLSQKLKEMV